MGLLPKWLTNKPQVGATDGVTKDNNVEVAVMKSSTPITIAPNGELRPEALEALVRQIRGGPEALKVKAVEEKEEAPTPSTRDMHSLFFYESGEWERASKFKAVFTELAETIRHNPFDYYKVSISVDGYKNNIPDDE